MPTNLNGIIFNQVYTDNTGAPGPEFDTDGDGTATQEDEFVSFTNLSGGDIDISGWQVWSDSTGSGAPDAPQDGLYHTFAPGTVLENGATLAVINETTGTPAFWAVEASEGGVESGAGGVSTNLLSEGNGGSQTESVVLLNPATGDYIVFNLAPNAFVPSNIAGFPGTNNVGEVDGHSVQADLGTGLSLQYDPGTDSYVHDTVFIPCFTPGTMIMCPGGERSVERLRIGDKVVTKDGRHEVVRAILTRTLDLSVKDKQQHQPVVLRRGCFGPDFPKTDLTVSPQHRMLMQDDRGQEVLVAAKALLDRPGIGLAKDTASVCYIQIVCAAHVILSANGIWAESFYPGRYAVQACDRQVRAQLCKIFPGLALGKRPAPARQLVSVGDAKHKHLSPVTHSSSLCWTRSRSA